LDFLVKQSQALQGCNRADDASAMQQASDYNC
jgi:hypothetical protein